MYAILMVTFTINKKPSHVSINLPLTYGSGPWVCVLAGRARWISAMAWDDQWLVKPGPQQRWLETVETQSVRIIFLCR